MAVPRSPLRHWLLWILWGAFMLALAACGVLMVVALLIWHQWILATFVAAIVGVWIYKLATHEEVHAFVRYAIATVRQ